MSNETDLFVKIIKEKYPDEEIKVILDLGSRDGFQSVEFAKHYPNAQIFAFECNPDTLGDVHLNTTNYENITVMPYAVGAVEGLIPFYKAIHGNPGASSIYRKSGKYDYIENYVQQKIRVEMKRIDSLIHSRVDVVWADIQGAELDAMKGMGELFKDVKAVFLEVEYKEMYAGQPLYDEIHEWLTSQGFEQKWIKKVHDDFFGEAIYIR